MHRTHLSSKGRDHGEASGRDCPQHGLLIDRNGAVSVIGQRLDQFFPGSVEHESTITSFMETAWKAGVIGAEALRGVDAALRCPGQHLFELLDGRSILLSTTFSDDQGMVATFTDVSFVVETALGQQRDVFTGLPNRPALMRQLNEGLSTSSKLREAALLLVDLDRFHAINEALGQSVGDALLKLVAERLQRLAGPQGFVAHLGSDEFAVLQTGGRQPEAAEALALKVIELMGRTFLVSGQTVQIGASVGISLVSTDGKTSEELVRNAGLALFKAKSAGRSSFRFFTEEMDAEVQARRALELDLRRALVLDEFSVVYQPQFEIVGNRLVGFEALMRWATPERGHVSPAEFIPLAEETGLIISIGEWILRTACMEAANWPGSVNISVNLSPVQISHPRIVDVIVSALASSGLAPHRLDLEITEGALMLDTEAVLATLERIRCLGIKISMDDFGTGYSSLSYLRKFPFDKIKIDQSFVRGLETDQGNAAIVRAVIALGDSLGMTTIAEGVETEAQLRCIADEGCKQVQGYLTGRPLSPQQASALMHRNQEEEAQCSIGSSI